MAEVLLIDDDTELCELVVEFLAGEGFSVEAVHDGSSGLERAQAGRHHAVVLDQFCQDLARQHALGTMGQEQLLTDCQAASGKQWR